MHAEPQYRNHLLLRLLIRDLWWQGPVLWRDFNKSLAKWKNELLAALTKLLILVVLVGLGYFVLLTYLDSFWALFSNTPMGNIFASQVSPGTVVAITAVLDLDLTRVTVLSMINALLVSVVSGVVLKFSGLYHLAVQNRGWFGAIFWGIVCAAVSAKLLPIVGTSDLRSNAAIYLLPSLGLLSGSFNLSVLLAPEFTVVFRFAEFLDERLKIIKIRDLPPPGQVSRP